MAEKIVFTMARIAKLKPFQTGRRTVYDERQPGLTVCVMPTGAVSFYLYAWANGKPRRVRIGSFPAISVDDARQRVRELIADYGKGNDPALERRKMRGDASLSELWQRFLDIKGPKKKARSLKEDEGLWNRYLESWQHRKASTITTDEVERWHAGIGSENGPYAANRALSLLSTLFTAAKLPNPCAGVERFAEVKRDRFLRPDELPKFLAALDAEVNQQIAGAFRLMLWTGARKMNVLSMRWADVDLAAGLWRIPDTKGGTPHVLPLTEPAIDELKRLKLESSGSAYVFPSRVKTGTAPHLVDVTKSWTSVCEAAGLSDVRLHDLRRTMASWQAIGGESLVVIGKMLGHRNSSTTEIYARLSVDPVRQAMMKATAAMQAAGKAEGGAE